VFRCRQKQTEAGFSRRRQRQEEWAEAGIVSQSRGYTRRHTSRRAVETTRKQLVTGRPVLARKRTEAGDKQAPVGRLRQAIMSRWTDVKGQKTQTEARRQRHEEGNRHMQFCRQVHAWRQPEVGGRSGMDGCASVKGRRDVDGTADTGRQAQVGRCKQVLAHRQALFGCLADWRALPGWLADSVGRLAGKHAGAGWVASRQEGRRASA
jgi:hypothetical protein